jgi:predicted ATP-grasp superfamily ATP-dependent carboligase
MADALVTDVQNRGPLAGVRGLGRAGITVTAVATTPGAAGLRSRYATERALAPAADVDVRGFVARIGELTAHSSQTVIYPGDEESIDALMEFAGALPSGAVLPYPDPAAVRLVRDKAGLPELARGAGLRVPATIVRATARELALSRVQPPYVLKPEKSGEALKSALLVHDTAERDAVLAELPPDEPLFIQERAAGALMALALVISRDGSIAARFQQLTQRTWPADAGLSTLARSVPPDDELIERAARMMRNAGYWGLVNLQFIAGRGDPVLIDINPRFYGSMALAIGSGVNVAASWHAATLDRAAPAPGPYRIGVRYRWLEGDLLVALRARKWRALLPAGRPCVGSAWALDDPLPGAVVAATAISGRVRAQLSRDPGQS